MGDASTRAQYDNMADAYDKLAHNEEVVGRNLDRAAE